jgi:signal transduction histidine kinase
VGEAIDRQRRPMRERAGSIRVRTTTAAVVVVGVALVLAAVAMVTLQRGSLREQVEANTDVRARSLAEQLRSNPPADLAPFGDPEGDEEFIQILDPGGTVVQASPNVAGLPVVVRLDPGETRIIGPQSPPDREPLDEPFLVVAASSSGPDGRLTVIVGRSLEIVTEASQFLTRVLAIAMPLLLIVVGVVTWRVVARALSPVDAIRAEVDAISSRELYRRLPAPGGNDEIFRLATTMNRMLARLESGRLRERRFVSDASHELRSPVTTIRQHAEVALSHPEQTSTEDLAEIVLDEDARLQRLVEDLLLLTRIDEGTLELPDQPVDLDDLMFEEAARLRGATELKIDVGAVSAGRVRGDREKLGRLIRNLTDNAARHARTMIALSLAERNGEVVLGVDDDGAGIDEAEREHIFDRFVRLDEARDRDSGGSGLGLAIVREVAAFHGGTVVIIESGLGGIGFEVRLPRHPD